MKLLRIMRDILLQLILVRKKKVMMLIFNFRELIAGDLDLEKKQEKNISFQNKISLIIKLYVVFMNSKMKSL